MRGHQQENMRRIKYSYKYCHYYFEHDMHKQITEHKIEPRQVEGTDNFTSEFTQEYTYAISR